MFHLQYMLMVTLATLVVIANEALAMATKIQAVLQAVRPFDTCLG